jgi:rhodanese-related sulfurtransferase
MSFLSRLFARPYRTIDPAEAQEMVRQRRAVLVDVRERHEWQSGHAQGARHIPLGSLTERAGELPANRPLVTVCASGMRSRRAAGLLAAVGHEVYNLRGGMHAWAAAGLPVR